MENKDIKKHIADMVKAELTARNLSIRAFEDVIGENRQKIMRVTNENNYNMDTLVKILDNLDLELTISPKKID